MPNASDPSPSTARSVLVDASFRVIGASHLKSFEGLRCYEVMASRKRPCVGCPVYRLGPNGGADLRPSLQIERLGPGQFEWITVRQPEHLATETPCLQCSRVTLGEHMSSALESLCTDLRFQAIGEHVELLANKVQGLSLGIELLRGRIGDPGAQRLLGAMAENCRDLVQEIDRTRLHLQPTGPGKPE